MFAAAINLAKFRPDITIYKLCNRIQIQDRRMEFFSFWHERQEPHPVERESLIQLWLSNVENLVQGSLQYQNLCIIAI